MINEPLSKVWRRFGTTAAMRAGAVRLARKLAHTDAIHLMSWDWSEHERRAEPSSDNVRFERLSRADLFQISDDPDLDLTKAFAHEAAQRGDDVWGAWLDGELVAYQCYSRSIAEVPHIGAVMFPADRVYVYKVFTAPKARGRRLHRRLLLHCAEHFASIGVRGVVTYINALNETSFHAFAQAGFVRVGLAVRRGNRMLQVNRLAPGRPWLLLAPDATLAQGGPEDSQSRIGICQPPPTLTARPPVTI